MFMSGLSFIVVEGGLSGFTAAIELAAAGHNVSFTNNPNTSAASPIFPPRKCYPCPACPKRAARFYVYWDGNPTSHRAGSDTKYTWNLSGDD
jgi:heterodisulfide reductase subunit A-like polyferredoxin